MEATAVCLSHRTASGGPRSPTAARAPEPSPETHQARDAMGGIDLTPETAVRVERNKDIPGKKRPLGCCKTAVRSHRLVMNRQKDTKSLSRQISLRNPLAVRLHLRQKPSILITLRHHENTRCVILRP